MHTNEMNNGLPQALAMMHPCRDHLTDAMRWPIVHETPTWERRKKNLTKSAKVWLELLVWCKNTLPSASMPWHQLKDAKRLMHAHKWNRQIEFKSIHMTIKQKHNRLWLNENHHVLITNNCDTPVRSEWMPTCPAPATLVKSNMNERKKSTKY